MFYDRNYIRVCMRVCVCMRARVLRSPLRLHVNLSKRFPTLEKEMTRVENLFEKKRNKSRTLTKKKDYRELKKKIKSLLSFEILISDRIDYHIYLSIFYTIRYAISSLVKNYSIHWINTYIATFYIILMHDLLYI